MARFKICVSLLSVLVGCASGCALAPDPPQLPTAEIDPDWLARPHGAGCTTATQCAGGVCADGMCTEPCSLHDGVDSCAHVDAFCGAVGTATMACVGSIATGDDGDAALLSIGDSFEARMDSATDADLFLLDLREPGAAELLATADGVDVQLELYSLTGAPRGEWDRSGASGAESVPLDVVAPVHKYLVVRNIGGTTGPYRLEIRAR